MGDSMDLDTVNDEVFMKLPQLDVPQLGQCGVQLGVIFPVAMKGKKTAMRSFLLKHLTSDAMDANDEAEDIFRQLNTAMDPMLPDRGTRGVKSETDSGTTKGDDAELADKQVVKEENEAI